MPRCLRGGGGWAVLEMTGRLAFKGMIMIFEDLIVTSKASVVLISEAQATHANSVVVSARFGWV